MSITNNSEQRRKTKIIDQPLTKSLYAKQGNDLVTADWLVTLPINNFDAMTVEWLDNSHLIFALPPIDITQEKKIEVIDIITGLRTILSDGETPTPSPDGERIAFIRSIDKKQQLWLMRSDGSQAKQITDEPFGLGIYKYNFNFAWSSNSKYIALCYLVDTLHSVCDVIEIASAKSQRILSIDSFQIRWLAWSSDDKELFFWKEQIEGEAPNQEDRELIQSVRLNDAHVRTLTQFDGLQQQLDPTVSPDGQQIAMMYDPDHPYFDTTQNIGLISTTAIVDNHHLPPIKRLTSELKLQSPKWSRDGQSIYALRLYGAYKQIYNIHVKTGKIKQITNAPFSVHWNGYALSPDGSKLAYIALNAHATHVLRVANACDGENINNIVTISTTPDNMALSEVREIEWDTINYPSRMRGLLILPLHYKASSHYPLIVDIHGGGSSATLALYGGILVSTPLEWQMWAAKGYAVFIPEFRSSGAFGTLADTRDNLQEHNIIDCDVMDIISGVDALISSDIVDKQRMAVIGHSAGARRANWLTVTRHQFKAVVSKEGWSDELIEALNPLEIYPINRVSRIFHGSPQVVPQNYSKNSALSRADDAKTPTLFLMANPKMGGRDFMGTVQLLYEAIKAKCIETQYVEYSDEGHVFEKQKNRLDALKRSEKWIDDYLAQ